MWRSKKKTQERCSLLRRLTVGNGRTRFSTSLWSSTRCSRWTEGLLRGFLVGFCVALCFSVSRNSVLHACTAILRLVHDSDSGRASACTNFGIFFALDVFSPFAEEGFTCLDHSMMSKKKNAFVPAFVCMLNYSLLTRESSSRELSTWFYARHRNFVGLTYFVFYVEFRFRVDADWSRLCVEIAGL